MQNQIRIRVRVKTVFGSRVHGFNHCVLYCFFNAISPTFVRCFYSRDLIVESKKIFRLQSSDNRLLEAKAERGKIKAYVSQVRETYFKTESKKNGGETAQQLRTCTMPQRTRVRFPADFPYF